ncbi:hypothetical protein FACS18949_02010 [Clostridia bacterium]|nr:hypothetical protein FACS18949_02010 [Clostridia bacterium]
MARKSRKQPIIETIPATIIYNAAAYVRLSADDRRKNVLAQSFSGLAESIIDR